MVGGEKPSCGASPQSPSNIITLTLYLQKVNQHQAQLMENLSYLCVEIVEQDNEAERTPGHRLSWDEGVLEGGLSLRLDHSAQGQSCELHKHTHR